MPMPDKLRVLTDSDESFLRDFWGKLPKDFIDGINEDFLNTRDSLFTTPFNKSLSIGHQAAKQGYYQFFEALYEEELTQTKAVEAVGINTRADTLGKEPPLQLAMHHPKTVQALLKLGANPLAKDSDTSYTILALSFLNNPQSAKTMREYEKPSLNK